MFSTKRLLVLVLLCFGCLIFNWPLLAQETKNVEKLHCPYCGVTNLAASKFCGACGSKLPNASFSPTLAYQMTAMANDSSNATAFSGENSSRLKRPPGSIEGSVAAGILGGGIGFFAGGFAGAMLAANDSDEWSGLVGFVIGAPIGESLLLPVSVHVANGRRGNLSHSMLASFAIAGAGIAMAVTMEDGNVLIGIPIAQLLACTAIERSTQRRR